MTHTHTFHDAFAGACRFLEHTVVVMLGLLMMVVGLALGVTMVMLPAGVVVGLLGLALVVGGLFARIDSKP